MNDGLTISTAQLLRLFPDEDAARVYLEARLWPNGVKCPICSSGERIGVRKGGYYRCNACSEDFTVRTGTIFERSHVPLHKWLAALQALMSNPRMGSPKLAGLIEVTQKSAHGIITALRKAAGDMLPERAVEYRTLDEWPAYRIGSDGSVWSLWRKGPGSEIGTIWHRMSPTPDRDGYGRVCIVAPDGRRLTRKVAVLVCTAFHGPRPAGHEARHLDGDCSNDAAGNLQWGTPLENHADKRRHGTIARGARNARHRLTDEQIKQILALRGKALQREVAERFGLARGYVGQIWAVGGRPQRSAA